MARRPKQESPVTITRTEGTSGRPPAAIYNRVSTVLQDSSRAMEDLRRAAIQRGYDVVLEVHEQGSGKRNDRPGLAEVLDAARRGEVAAVFVMRLDRWGRSSLDLLANIKALTSAGVRFACVEQSIDVQPTGDAMGNLILSVLAGVAEFEHAIIVERVREGQARARKHGAVFGRPRDLGPDVEQIVALRKDGKSWSVIAGEVGCSVALARRRFDEISG